MKPYMRLMIPFIILLICGCGTKDPNPREQLPAEIESQRLGNIQTTNAMAAAESTAIADRLDQQLAIITEPLERAKIKAASDAARLAAAIAIAKRDASAELRADADKRAQSERAELEQLKQNQVQAVAVLADQERTLQDRRWAVIGLALCAAAGVALRVLGIPSLISICIPAAVATGCLFFIAWTSVPWLAVIIGWLLAAVVLSVLILIIRTVVVEWLRYADQLNNADPDTKALTDNVSRTSQSRWMAWIINYLLAKHSLNKPIFK